MTIVGVVGDVRQSGPADEPKPECYMTYRQHVFNGNTLSVVARTVGTQTHSSQHCGAWRKRLRRMSP